MIDNHSTNKKIVTELLYLIEDLLQYKNQIINAYTASHKAYPKNPEKVLDGFRQLVSIQVGDDILNKLNRSIYLEKFFNKGNAQFEQLIHKAELDKALIQVKKLLIPTANN